MLLFGRIDLLRIDLVCINLNRGEDLLQFGEDFIAVDVPNSTFGGEASRTQT